MPDVEIIHANHQGANVSLTADEARIQVIDPYKVAFSADGAIKVPTEAEDLDIPNATRVVGDGTITYAKATGAGAPTTITLRTTFAVGDHLVITCTGLTEHTSVRVPRLPIA